MDVAKQGGTSEDGKEVDTHSSPDHYAFCTYCEVRVVY